MTDEDSGLAWPPAMFKPMQEASEQAMETQQEFWEQMLQSGSAGLDMNQLGAMRGMATFKTRVQSGGRVSIPDAEREALDIEEGDIVQTVVFPVKRNRE
jgi:hypothetical protein